MTRRYYSSTAEPATLASGVNASATNIQVSTVAGWPVSYPYTIAVDIDTVDEEVMDVVGASGTTLTVTRGVAGSAAVDHLAGANIRHIVDGRDFNDWSEHVDSASAHGTSGGVVGVENEQTLINKTLVLPSIGAILNAGSTLFVPTDGTRIASGDGSDVLSDKTIENPNVTGGSADFDNLFIGGIGVVTLSDSQTLTGKILSNAELTGSTVNSGTINGGTVNADTLRQSGVDVVTVSGTQALTNKTLTAPIITAGALDSASTFDGARIAKRPFAPVWAGRTTPSSTISAGDFTDVLSVNVPGSDGVLAEAVFTFSQVVPTGGAAPLVQIRVNGTTVGVCSLDGISGGMIRAIYVGTGEPVVVTARFTNSVSGTAQIFASAIAPMVLSVRPFDL